MKIAIPFLLVGVVLGFGGSLLLLDPGPRALPPAPDTDLEAEVERLENQNLSLAAQVDKLDRAVQEYKRQLREAASRLSESAEEGAEEEAVEGEGGDPDAELAAAEAAEEAAGNDQGRRGRGQRWGRDEPLTPEQILSMLSGDDVRDRMRALRALSSLPDKQQAYALALEQLQNEDNPNWVLYQALEALVDLDPTAAAAAIAPFMTGEDTRMASLAARQLGGIDTQDSRAALFAGLESKSDRVRLDSARALQKLGDSSGITQIGSELIGEMGNPDGGVREDAVRQLVSLRDPSFNGQLVAALVDTNSQVREEAAEGLGRLGTPADLAALEALRDDPQEDVVRAAERAIRLIQNPEEQQRAAAGGRGRGGFGGAGRGGGGRGGR